MNKAMFKFTNAQKLHKQRSEATFVDFNAVLPQKKPSDSKNLFKSTIQRAISTMRVSKGPVLNQNDSYCSVESTHNSDQESRIAYILKKIRKNSKDSQAIYDHIKKYPAFTSFIETCMTEVETEAVYQICRHMSYERIPAGKWVMKEGDLSNDKFYIVLSGSVSVILNGSNVYTEQNLEDIERENDKKGDFFEDSPQGRVRHNDLKSKVDKYYEPRQTSINRSSLSPHRENFQRESQKNSTFLSEFGKAANFLRRSEQLAEDPDDDDNRNKKSQNSASQTAGAQLINCKAGLKVTNETRDYHVISKVLREGESFGEKALTNPAAKRSASILTDTDSEFIILYKDDFLKIYNRFSLQNKRKAEFLRANMPDLDQVSSRKIFEDLMYSVQEIDSVKGNVITLEGAAGDKIFMLVEGSCSVSRNLEDIKPEDGKPTHKLRRISQEINEIGSGTIIGEELLFIPKRTYKYTVKVLSLQARLYYIKAKELKIKFPKQTLIGLSKNFEKKEELRSKRIEELRKVKTQIITVQNAEAGLKNVLKHFSEGKRHKNNSNVDSRGQKDIQQSNNSSNNSNQQLSLVSREYLAFSRNYKNIQLHLNLKAHKTNQDYNTVFEKCQKILDGGDNHDHTQRSISASLDSKNFFETPRGDSLQPKWIPGSTPISKEDNLNDTKDRFFGLTATIPTDASNANCNTLEKDLLAYKEDLNHEKPELGSAASETASIQSHRNTRHSASRTLSNTPKLQDDNRKFRIKESVSTSRNSKADQEKKSIFASMANEAQFYENEDFSNSPKKSKTHQTSSKSLQSPNPNDVKSTIKLKNDQTLVQSSMSNMKTRELGLLSENGGLELACETPPNKRNFVIRQKIRAFNEEQPSKSLEDHHKKFELIKVENQHETHESLNHFNFGSTRFNENQIEQRKKFFQFRMNQVNSGYLKSSSVRRERTSQIRRSEPSFINLLRLVTPGRERLYKDLKSEFLNTDLMIGTPKVRVAHHQEPVLEIDLTKTDLNSGTFFMDQNNNTYTCIGQTATASTIDSVIQSSTINMKPMTTKSKSRTDVNAKDPRELTLILGSKVSNPIIQEQEAKIYRKRPLLHQKQLSTSSTQGTKLDGTTQSLKIKNDIHKALDARRKRQVWKDNFANDKTTHDDPKSVLGMVNITHLKDKL